MSVCPSGYVDPLQALSDVVAQLDAVVSLAAAAVSAPVPYVRPRLLAPEEGPRRLELLQARHPCLETDADSAFIPNDISFTRGEKSFYIITGEKGCGRRGVAGGRGRRGMAGLIVKI